jgi:hypothetical protein
MYARFAAELPSFLRQRVTPEIARANFREQLAARESNFLRMVRLAVFSRPDSPYLFLFRDAGCELGDVEKSVAADGLDAALGSLYDAGIRISFDEMKGRAPLTRSGRTMEITSDSFDNPFSVRHYQSQTSGSTGRATRVNMDLSHVASIASSMILTHQFHGVMDAPVIIYSPGMPSSTAINNILRHNIVANPVRRWFSPIPTSGSDIQIRFRIAQLLIPRMVRAFGGSFPRPEIVPFSEAVTVARAAAELVASDGRCLVRGAVSSAHTVALSAAEAGIDLTGVTFAGGGEPPTPAKVRGIESSGGRYVTTYSMNEAGTLGVACPNAEDRTDVHFLLNRLGLVIRPQPVPGSDDVVDSLHLTSLLPTSPKILINASSDDFAIVERRACGCPFEELGLGLHVRQVRSVRKLTGRGITLVGSEIASIIEEQLPARFGGSAQDFQLVEEEDTAGRTKLVLLVSPSVSLANETDAADALLNGLSRSTPGANLGGAMLRSAAAVTVRREKPRPSARGKQPAFRIAATQR